MHQILLRKMSNDYENSRHLISCQSNNWLITKSSAVLIWTVGQFSLYHDIIFEKLIFPSEMQWNRVRKNFKFVLKYSSLIKPNRKTAILKLLCNFSRNCTLTISSKGINQIKFKLVQCISTPLQRGADRDQAITLDKFTKVTACTCHMHITAVQFSVGAYQEQSRKLWSHFMYIV